jgi:hypothetical protein
MYATSLWDFNNGRGVLFFWHKFFVTLHFCRKRCRWWNDPPIRSNRENMFQIYTDWSPQTTFPNCKLLNEFLPSPIWLFVGLDRDVLYHIVLQYRMSWRPFSRNWCVLSTALKSFSSFEINKEFGQGPFEIGKGTSWNSYKVFSTVDQWYTNKNVQPVIFRLENRIFQIDTNQRGYRLKVRVI